MSENYVYHTKSCQRTTYTLGNSVRKLRIPYKIVSENYVYHRKRCQKTTYALGNSVRKLRLPEDVFSGTTSTLGICVRKLYIYRMKSRQETTSTIWKSGRETTRLLYAIVSGYWMSNIVSNRRSGLLYETWFEKLCVLSAVHSQETVRLSKVVVRNLYICHL